jgi:hypothetical protein
MCHIPVLSNCNYNIQLPRHNNLVGFSQHMTTLTSAAKITMNPGSSKNSVILLHIFLYIHIKWIRDQTISHYRKNEWEQKTLPVEMWSDDCVTRRDVTASDEGEHIRFHEIICVYIHVCSAFVFMHVCSLCIMWSSEIVRPRMRERQILLVLTRAAEILTRTRFDKSGVYMH